MYCLIFVPNYHDITRAGDNTEKQIQMHWHWARWGFEHHLGVLTSALSFLWKSNSTPANFMSQLLSCFTLVGSSVPVIQWKLKCNALFSMNSNTTKGKWNLTVGSKHSRLSSGKSLASAKHHSGLFNTLEKYQVLLITLFHDCRERWSKERF